MDVRIQVVDRPWSHPDGEYLRQLQREEIAATYGRPDSEPGTPPSADDIVVFVVAYVQPPQEANGDKTERLDAIPIACGALRLIANDSEEERVGDVEIKRMFVHPDYRGKPWGAARAVLATLEGKARENGWMRMVLETGPLQAAAIKFYQREGYVAIPKFGAYLAADLSLCFGKTLEVDLVV